MNGSLLEPVTAYPEPRRLPRSDSHAWEVPPHRRSHLPMWWAFALGLGTATYVNLGGFLSLAEIMMATTGIFVLGKRIGYLREPAIAAVFFLTGVMFVAAPLSELINQSESWQFLRGIPRAYAFLFSFLVLLVLFRDDSRCIAPFLIGVCISQIVGMYYFKNGWLTWQETYRGARFAIDWKTGYNYPFNTFVLWLALVQYRKRPRMTVIGLLSASTVNLLLGSRSQGLCMAIGGAFGLIRYVRSRNILVRLPTRLSVSVILVAMSAATVVFFKSAGHYAAQTGWMDQQQAEKFLAQSKNPYGMLAASRGSVLATILAVYDKPIMGHGSWALDKEGADYARRADQILGRNNPLGYTNSRISFHSLLFGDWMQWGFVFGVFWAWIFFRSVRFMALGIQNAGAVTAFLGVLVPMLMWNILFSPVGHRTWVAAQAAIVFIFSSSASSTSPKPADRFRR